MSRNAEGEGAKGNRERVGEEDVGETRMRTLYLHRVLSPYDEMSKLFKDNWR